MTQSAEIDALRDAVNDAVANTLGRYRDIGIGPERTAFREDVVAAVMRVIPPDVTRGEGRPLGVASGGDVAFWDRLGTDDGGMPAHLPIGVNAYGQGPEDDSAAYTFTCWCGDVECPLSLALGHAWAAGRRVTPPVECRCGWGGVHDPDNPRCPANGAPIPPEAKEEETTSGD